MAVIDVINKYYKAVSRTLIDHMDLFSKFKIQVNNISIRRNKVTVNWTLEGVIKKENKKKTFSGTDYFETDKNGQIYLMKSTWNP